MPIHIQEHLCIKITTGNIRIAANKIKKVEHIEFHIHKAYAHHKFLLSETNLHLYFFFFFYCQHIQ
jgi:hypothetical protein